LNLLLYLKEKFLVEFVLVLKKLMDIADDFLDKMEWQICFAEASESSVSSFSFFALLVFYS
jgi:hypothetical protein